MSDMVKFSWEDPYDTWKMANREHTPITVMPTTTRPEKPPARRATTSASRADRRAAPATRMLARTDTHMPTYPATAEQKAPKRKETVVRSAIVPWVSPASICSCVTWRKL